MFELHSLKSHRPILVLGILVLITGCGTATRDAAFTSDFTPSKPAIIYVDEIVDAAPKGNRGEQENFDTELQLRTQLENILSKNGMLAKGEAGEEPYVLKAKIVDYDPGSAGKRWLWPGYEYKTNKSYFSRIQGLWSNLIASFFSLFLPK